MHASQLGQFTLRQDFLSGSVWSCRSQAKHSVNRLFNQRILLGLNPDSNRNQRSRSVPWNMTWWCDASSVTPNVWRIPTRLLCYTQRIPSLITSLFARIAIHVQSASSTPVVMSTVHAFLAMTDRLLQSVFKIWGLWLWWSIKSNTQNSAQNGCCITWPHLIKKNSLHKRWSRAHFERIHLVMQNNLGLGIP